MLDKESANRDFSLDELAARDLEGGVTKVNENHATGLLGLGREISLVDAIGECNGSSFVHETHAVDAGNLGGLDNSDTLEVIVEAGNSNDSIDGFLRDVRWMARVCCVQTLPLRASVWKTVFFNCTSSMAYN
jgi:hypothetical protein